MECYYLRSSVDIVCDAHNTLWCGRNERECEIPEREGEYIIGIVSDTLQNYRIKHHYRVKRYMRIIGLHFYLFYIYIYICVRSKSPVTGPVWPRGFQED